MYVDTICIYEEVGEGLTVIIRLLNFSIHEGDMPQVVHSFSNRYDFEVNLFERN